jgi:hypothetical protein
MEGAEIRDVKTDTTMNQIPKSIFLSKMCEPYLHLKYESFTVDSIQYSFAALSIVI